ncbi:formate dehydrogenase subunit alpha [Methylophaga thiooxydans]|uniref:NADH-quinone oxidoreductase subunit G n=1 Tax=Methylophaga thiooxydans DMS010 TaxID=637616 RepID=C0N6M2_9GAMM|nr:formate dehydrogenase subunit alpha [Methylophaga thiooxydans]EEF79670.1 formate dehydrogenase, alpha subunit [Methylophaga thiooxydans DMS010]
MAINPNIENELVSFNLNGEAVFAEEGETILQAAQRHGVEIPHLCYSERQGQDGNCRACMVEIDGERVLAPSCCRYPSEGMKVDSQSQRALHSQKLVLEMLKSDVSEQPHTLNSELDYWAGKLEISTPRFKPRKQAPADLSHPGIAVNMDACIQCTRCVRACRDEQNNDVIGLAMRGNHTEIVFDLDDPMGESSCVACGECVEACPTGALMPANDVAMVEPDKKVDSVCPYCGVGCQLTYNIKDNKILYVEGRDGPANHGRLCVKGRYGFDYVHHPHRLTKPLIRRDDAPKTPDFSMDPNDIDKVFREATWEEALALAAKGFVDIRDSAGPNALAGFGSAKGSNEEAYLFQKLVRVGFNTNNVDHCTRLCHASSVVALLECLGSGAVSNPVSDVDQAEVIVLIGANPTVNHPVGATWMKNAIRNGTKLILMDPRGTELSQQATHHLQFKPGSDVPMLNAIMHVIVEEGLVDKDFIADRTSGFDEMKRHLQKYTPELMEPVCGIPAETLREVARLYATSKGSMILWGMGVSQHIHGTDNARCLISLALMTGQIGRPGTGLHPLRGQNNVQGASDMGLIPMCLPDYYKVDDDEARGHMEALWGGKIDSKAGLTVVEIMDAIHAGNLHGLYIMGENPAMSDPDANHARQAMSELKHMVVQDIFLTETAYLADVVLPASGFPEKTGTFTNTDRLVQLGRQAIDPPGDARQDLWIIQELAKRLGLDWNYQGPADVFAEIRKAVPSMGGITWDRLEAEHSVVYPCEQEGDPGEDVIFTQDFPTASGRGLFVPADIVAPDERPDDDYPFVLITGRMLEHWHTGSMTRRSNVLDALEPEAVATINPITMDEMGVKPGELITLSTRRGSVSVLARADIGVPTGAVFMAFCYYEAAVNKLSNPALDPAAKIPEFKYCAVNVTPGGEPMQFYSYGGGQSKNQLV